MKSPPVGKAYRKRLRRGGRVRRVRVVGYHLAPHDGGRPLGDAPSRRLLISLSSPGLSPPRSLRALSSFALQCCDSIGKGPLNKGSSKAQNIAARAIANPTEIGQAITDEGLTHATPVFFRRALHRALGVAHWVRYRRRCPHRQPLRRFVGS